MKNLLKLFVLMAVVVTGGVTKAAQWAFISGNAFNGGSSDNGASFVIQWSIAGGAWANLVSPLDEAGMRSSGGASAYVAYTSTSNWPPVMFKVRLRGVYTVAPAGTFYSAESPSFSQNDINTVNLAVANSACAAGFYSGRICADNNTGFGTFGVLLKNGVTTSSSIWLEPGETGCITYLSCGTNDVYTLSFTKGGYIITASYEDGQPVQYITGQDGYQDTGATPSYTPSGSTSSTTTGSDGSGNGTPPSTYSGNTTNGPITFPDTNNIPAGSELVVETLKQGFNALYDATTKGFDQLDRDSKQINTSVVAVNTNLNAVRANIVQVSNAVFGAASGVTNLVAGLRNAVTNQLSYLTNAAGVGTNLLSQNTNLMTQTTNLLSRLTNYGSLQTNLLAGISNRLYDNYVGGSSNDWDIGRFLSNAITSAIAGNTNGTGGGTNLFNDAGITNAIGVARQANTNALWSIYDYLTNRPDSNAIASIVQNGTNNGDTVRGAWDGVVGGVFNGTGPADGGDFTYEVDIAQGLSMTIASASIPGRQYMDTARLVCSWAVYFAMLFAMYRYGENCMDKVLNQRQTQGNTEAILGTNVSVATSAGYAVVISVLVISIPAAIASYLTSGSVGMGTGFAAITGLGGSNEWAAASMIIPVGTMITCALTYAIYRYVVAFPLTLVLRTIILWLLA